MEDIPGNPTPAPTLGDVINRRDILKGALGVTAMGVLARVPLIGGAEAAGGAATRFAFSEIGHGADQTDHVAPGYTADVLMRWGDKVAAHAPAFDPMNHSAAAQLRQHGYNNDYVGYVPLPFGSPNSERGLLCINHEYTDEEFMLPGYGKHDETFGEIMREIVDIEMAAHGGSIIEIEKVDRKWRVVQDSRYARRISAPDTAMAASGPAAGSDRLKTSEDPSGTLVVGTINNCAGGIATWGT